MPGMAARGKNAVAVFSLVMLALLACGFVGRIGFDVHYKPANGRQTLYQDRELALEGGRVRCYSISSSTKPAGFAGKSYIRPIIRFWPPRPPDVKQSLFGFDAHPMPGMPKGQQMFLLSCPIWFAALPFLIGPGVWLLKRRRREPARFAIIVGDEKSV